MTVNTDSWLDRAATSKWATTPFFEETVELLRCVRDHDFDTLSELCDDDFGIVDLDPSGNSVMIRTREDWEAWFRRLFAELDAVAAATDSEILEYQSVETPEMGFSVVEFRQSLEMAGQTAFFDCVATIVWKRTQGGWKEARWHLSLLSSQVPQEFS